MPLRYRRAKLADIPGTMHLLEPDRPLFSSTTWSVLPELLTDLFERERILLCLVEDSDSQEARLLGGSGFLDPSFLESAKHNSSENLLELAFAAERDHRPVFLNVKQVARANRLGDLRLFSFFGSPRKFEPNDPNRNYEVNISLEAWGFLHKGFQLCELWFIAGDAQKAELFRGAGLRLFREGLGRNGAAVCLFISTRTDALQNPASWPASHILAPLPKFAFTRPQQQLLEFALLDYSDRQVESELCVSADAIKKRWRAIYEKVAKVEPSLLLQETGADRRRILLQRIRQHLEELRPW